MGYFDALASSSFKTGEDGRKLFFPWGVFGGGYVIGSEQDYERLRRQVKSYMIVSMVMIIGFGAFGGPLFSISSLIPLLGFYLIWMIYLLPRLRPSNETLSLQESMSSQARTHNKVVLWVLEIGSLAFVATGIAMLIFDPGSRLVALASIAFFGLCAAKATHLLVLRHRADMNRA